MTDKFQGWYESHCPPIEVGGRMLTILPSENHVMVVAQHLNAPSNAQRTHTISVLMNREQVTSYVSQLLTAARLSWPDFKLEEIP